ncbi:MAG: GNAT family N-acetyltransferase [Fimbriimonadaceae bacterium]
MVIRQMDVGDLDGVVALQRACFPPPFPEELLWQRSHLERHIAIFPEGQFVADTGGLITGSASSCLVSESNWQAHLSWDDTVGGPLIANHDPEGSTLFALDVSVHPEFRRQGIARQLYQARMDLVRSLGLRRLGAPCRIPGFHIWNASTGGTALDYATLVAEGALEDRTMTPLLRLGLQFEGVIENHMEDAESGNAAAIMTWTP